MFLKHLILPTLIALAFWGCNNNSDVEADGGFCSYKTIVYPAKIIKIDSLSQTELEIIFEVKWEESSDTFYYSYEFSDYISPQVLDSIGLTVGDTVQYEHQQITEGSCNPDIFSLTMNKY